MEIMMKHDWIWDMSNECYSCPECLAETKYKGSKTWDSECEVELMEAEG